MEDKRNVGFCPHCGNKSPQKLIHVQDTTGTGWIIDNGEEIDLTAVDHRNESWVC